jgi:hypothetical protein
VNNPTKKPRGFVDIDWLVIVAIGVFLAFLIGLRVSISIESKENKKPEAENFYHAELNGHSYIHSPDCPCGAY